MKHPSRHSPWQYRAVCIKKAIKHPPILYTFRRCPYAIRARMALSQAGIQCEMREVALKCKPHEMLSLSPKATVPVLHIPQADLVLDESIDIMLWALKQSAPDHRLTPDQESIDHMLALIERNDGDFKYHLDRYKYPNRYEDVSDASYHREQACLFLNMLETRLQTSTYLFGTHASLADVAIFPFVRQFAAVDQDWFEQTAFPPLQQWLKTWLDDARFQDIMHKRTPWQQGDKAIFMFTPPSPESCD